jgi:2-methylaconitate cis-trans-isomerase PrpF
MPITAIPKGVELRKITAVQKRALDELITKERGSSALTTAILVGIPSIIAGSAVLAYVFKEEAKTWFAEQEENFREAVVKVVAGAGGGIVDVVLDTANKVFQNNPKTPKVVNGSELTRCTRWAVDATDVLALVQKGNLTKAETVTAAFATIAIAKAMKLEGCSRPAAISQDQWDEA